MRSSMRQLILSAFLLYAASAASAALADDSRASVPFPLPSAGKKPLAIAPAQRIFRIPMRYAKVEAFYRERFAGEKKVSFLADRKDDQKTLTVISRRTDDTWARATIREELVDTVIEVTPIVRIEQAETIEGRGLPLVQLVMPRSQAAAEQVRSIDHMASGPGH